MPPCLPPAPAAQGQPLGAALAAAAWLIVGTIATGARTSAQAPGLRVFQAIGSLPTRIVDNLGNVVHSYPGGAVLSAHVAEDGTLVRSQQIGGIAVPGATGRLQRLAFDGTVLWQFDVSGPFEYAHHDIEPMPNGNVLVIAWDRYTTADAIAAGRDPGLVSGTDWLPDAILEIAPTGPTAGAIVWEWHMTDHVIQDFDPTRPDFGVVANHPELLDLNYPPVLVTDGDWNHFNGLDYDPVNDWIIVSSRAQNEIYLIDHSTTTAEAAGHTGGARGRGGDILYRWGNPEAYRAGTAANLTLNGQHDPRFVPPGFPGAGNLTMFNNVFLPGQSAVHEFAIPLDAQGNPTIDPVTGRYGPAAPTWTFTEPGFFSAVTSSAERLPNGNTLICSGTQRELREVTPAGQTVWQFSDPANPSLLFQCNYVDRSLWHDTTELSAGVGGTIGLGHLTGSAHAGELYQLLGSISGTAPGTTLPGGVHLPLNIDFLTQNMATNYNNALFVDTIGALDGMGAGTSAIVVQPGLVPTALVGVELDFAHLVWDATLSPVRASNSVRVTITP